MVNSIHERKEPDKLHRTSSLIHMLIFTMLLFRFLHLFSETLKFFQTEKGKLHDMHVHVINQSVHL